MGQIHGSNMGSPVAIVDDSGRLYTSPDNLVLDKVKIRGSGLVFYPKQKDRLMNGNLYQAGSYFQEMVKDTSGGVFLCAGSNDVHLQFDARTDGDCILEVWENVHVSNSGISFPIFNRSRHASILGSTLDATLWTNPTITESGAMIHSAMFLGGSGTGTKFQSSTVSIAPGNADWLFETGSCYYIQLKNICGRNLNADFNLVLYEHKHT